MSDRTQEVIAILESIYADGRHEAAPTFARLTGLDHDTALRALHGLADDAKRNAVAAGLPLLQLADGIAVAGIVHGLLLGHRLGLEEAARLPQGVVEP